MEPHRPSAAIPSLLEALHRPTVPRAASLRPTALPTNGPLSATAGAAANARGTPVPMAKAHAPASPAAAATVSVFASASAAASSSSPPPFQQRILNYEGPHHRLPRDAEHAARWTPLPPVPYAALESRRAVDEYARAHPPRGLYIPDELVLEHVEIGLDVRWQPEQLRDQSLSKPPIAWDYIPGPVLLGWHFVFDEPPLYFQNRCPINAASASAAAAGSAMPPSAAAATAAISAALASDAPARVASAAALVVVDPATGEHRVNYTKELCTYPHRLIDITMMKRAVVSHGGVRALAPGCAVVRPANTCCSVLCAYACRRSIRTSSATGSRSAVTSTNIRSASSRHVRRSTTSYQGPLRGTHNRCCCRPLPQQLRLLQSLPLECSRQTVRHRLCAEVQAECPPTHAFKQFLRRPPRHRVGSSKLVTR